MNLIEMAVKNNETLYITRSKRQVTGEYDLSNLTASSRKRLQAIAFVNEWDFEQYLSSGIHLETQWDKFHPVIKGSFLGKCYLLWHLMSDDEQQILNDLRLQEV